MKKLSIALCLLLTGQPMAYAASSASEAKGDAQAGQTKSALCAACHGPTGNSPTPIWPNLAGQHESYIVQQLKNFKSGARHEPTMTPMAMPLTEQDMLDIAAYYASQTMESGTASEELLELGQKIYRGGNKETGVSACIACHGPTGAGNPAAKYPRVNAQQADYNLKQLKDYAKGESGDRKPQGLASNMRDIASKMTEEEMKAVADYMRGLNK